MKTFSAKIFKIGINPYVLLPRAILQYLFKLAGKEKGHIPVVMEIKNERFKQTLVKYSGKWRLYVNTPMRKAAGKEHGDTIRIKIDFDGADRTVPIHPQLLGALKDNPYAKQVFDKLTPSRQKEIARYLNNLKTEESLARNITRAINFLQGKERFVGRSS